MTDLNRYTDEGARHSSGQFTLDSAAAWKKMRTFQVAAPQRFACEMVAAAVSLRARWLEITTASNSLTLSLRGVQLGRAQLEQLLSNPAGHPLSLALVSAQAYYGDAHSYTLSCCGASCRIEADRLNIQGGPEMAEVRLEIKAASRSFFRTARLDHQSALSQLELECQDGLLPIEVNGRGLNRPPALGDSLTLLILSHPECNPTEIMGRPCQRLVEPSAGAYCAIIACLSRKEETVISNGRVLLRRRTPGYAAFVFLLEAQLDLSGELVGEGRPQLEMVQQQAERVMLDWASRTDLPEAYRERANQFWGDWLERDPHGPLADRLYLSCCDGTSITVREAMGKPAYVHEEANPRLQGTFLLPHPLLSRISPSLCSLAPLPAGIRLRLDPLAAPNFGYDPACSEVEVVIASAELYQAVLSKAQLLPPGSCWSAISPADDPGLLLLDWMRQAARDPARLNEVLAYLSWLGQRFATVLQRFVTLRMRLRGRLSIPTTALDAVLGQADEHARAWLVEAGLPVELGELAEIPFVPTRAGPRLSLRQLQSMDRIGINLEEPESVQVPTGQVAGLQQFLGAARHGAGAWGSRSEQSGYGL
ncbi:MAG: hypothetical protein U0931_32195 [Vulcanimicrobiota bacterium]